MARQTRKLTTAISTARANKVKLKSKDDHEAVYSTLNKHGFFWDHKKGVWEKTDQNYLPNSIFQALDGQASGIVNIRLMMHPSDVDRMKEIMVEALDTYGLRLIEASHEYPNRKGVGTRVYLKFQLPPKSPKLNRSQE